MSDTKLIETNPPFMVILGLWWAILWRMMVYIILVMLALLVLSIPLLFLYASMSGTAMPMPGTPQFTAFEMTIGILGNIIGFAISIYANCRALRKVTGKKFSGYRLVFLTPQAVEQADRAEAAANLAAANAALQIPQPPSQPAHPPV